MSTMTPQKFDTNNLPDLKIRVSLPQVSKVIDLFKELGAKEYPTTFFKCEQDLFLYYAPDLQRVEYSAREKNFALDCGQEITLTELEALSAEKQKNAARTYRKRPIDEEESEFEK